VPGKHDGQPSCREEQGQRPDPAGCKRINMDDNAFPRARLGRDVNRQPVHSHLPMR